MCATKTYASTITGPASLSDDRHRSTFVTVMTVIVEAFQEALAMRRAAQGKYLLNDE